MGKGEKETVRSGRGTGKAVFGCTQTWEVWCKYINSLHFVQRENSTKVNDSRGINVRSMICLLLNAATSFGQHSMLVNN
jgi:hypothetical protein